MKDRETLHYFRNFFKLNIVKVAQLVESCATVFYTILCKCKKNGSNNIVVFLTIQYYCLSLRHE